MPSICFITPGHLASTPRLVREADAFADAGYKVHVVYGRHFPPADLLDQALLSRNKWQAHPVKLTGTFLSKLASARHRLLSRMPVRTWQQAALACQAHVHLLAQAAESTGAEAFHGHCLGGLGAAAWAAKRLGVRFGFDIEDFHETETERFIGSRLQQAANLLQAFLLPQCSVLTASSETISARCKDAYGVSSAITHNVYPLSESPSLFQAPPPVSENQPARFYWFSQTVGHGRGLEEAIQVLGLMKTPVELNLRGFVSDGYREELQALGQRVRLRHPLVFLPPGLPDAMPLLCAGYHMGLSLERRTPDNRNICLTNKIFAYLAAGLPVWLSDTDAQRAFSGKLGEASLLAEPSHSSETAAALDTFLQSQERIEASARKAWDIARSCYCWDKEQEIVLSAWSKARAHP